MDKIKPIEKISSASFQSRSLKENSKKFGQMISCALLGSKVCPKPDKCNGIERKCTIWRNHSGK